MVEKVLGKLWVAPVQVVVVHLDAARLGIVEGSLFDADLVVVREELFPGSNQALGGKGRGHPGRSRGSGVIGHISPQKSKRNPRTYSEFSAALTARPPFHFDWNRPIFGTFLVADPR